MASGQICVFLTWARPEKGSPKKGMAYSRLPEGTFTILLLRRPPPPGCAPLPEGHEEPVGTQHVCPCAGLWGGVWEECLRSSVWHKTRLKCAMDYNGLGFRGLSREVTQTSDVSGGSVEWRSR